MALKSFRQPEKFSDTGRTLSPAEQARATIDARIGGVVVQNYNWRRIAIGLLVACIALSIGLTVQSLKSQIIPYVVTVDKATGEVEKAGAFVSQDYTPQEAEVRYFIGQFIQNARSIQLDPVQQEKMQGKAYAYLTQAAAQKYAAIQRNEGFKESTPRTPSRPRLPESKRFRTRNPTMRHGRKKSSTSRAASRTRKSMSASLPSRRSHRRMSRPCSSIRSGSTSPT